MMRRLLLALALISAPLLATEPPTVEAPSYILIEQDSGVVLAAGDADAARPPASLTKIMTGFVVFEAIAAGEIALGDEVRISKMAWRAGRDGSRTFLRQGSRVPLVDVMRGMAIQSGNDAAVALAEHVAGSEATFVARMNLASERLGLTRTHWANASGLSHDAQYSSARDLATLTRAMIARHPSGYAYYGGHSFEWDGVKQNNRNPLMKYDPTVDGVKTGFTKDAGYCFVGSAKRNGQRLIVVVMAAANNRSRALDASALLEWGFAEAAGTERDPLLDSAVTAPTATAPAPDTTTR